MCFTKNSSMQSCIDKSSHDIKDEERHQLKHSKFLKITKHVSGLNSEWSSGERITLYSRAQHTGARAKRNVGYHLI